MSIDEVKLRPDEKSNNMKSHIVSCASFKVGNKSKGGKGRLRVFEAAVEESKVGGEQVGKDEQVRPSRR